ncbi:hypothetical protein DRQ17_00455 [bacterium]|nr:MAG: hypothetical protein DRQ17_00455 [bacterium]
MKLSLDKHINVVQNISMGKKQIKVERVSLDSLSYLEGNPRKLSKTVKKRLKDSISQFGYISPVIIDTKNRIIAGNQRVKVLRELIQAGQRVQGVENGEITAVRLVGYSEEELKIFSLAENKIRGDWDTDKLVDFIKGIEEKITNVDDIFLSGFSKVEIDRVLEEVVKKQEEPEFTFTQEVLDESNYILFVFNNSFDWEFIKNEFNIRPVFAKDSKKGYERMGIGRVLDGRVLINKLKGGKK